jgi:ubiquinone/menaquinone biosynthesis C-methylase UbiE
MKRYDITAEMYDMRYAAEQTAKYKAALNNWSIDAVGKVLDIGCGTGLLFSHFATKAQMMVGSDLSIKLLYQAKKRAQEFHNVHLVRADADHLPFKKNLFNMVFVFTVLQNLPKPLATLFEIKLITHRTAPIVVTGLKKIISLTSFKQLLRDAGLRVVSLNDFDELNCYIAVTVRN